jgi:hypothetical protein
MSTEATYDGVYFHPSEDDGGMEMAFFKADTDLGKPIGGSEVGDMFHFAFFKMDDEGLPMFDEVFEAVLGDPLKYLTGLVGSGSFGCLLRKSEKSHIWLKEYLKQANTQIKAIKEREQE